MSKVRIATGGSVLCAENDACALTFDTTNAAIGFRAPLAPASVSNARALIEYRLDSRCIVVRFADLAPSCATSDFDDAHGSGSEILARGTTPDGMKVSLAVRMYEARPFLLLRCGIENNSGHEIRLDRFSLLEALPAQGSTVELGAPAGNASFFKVGWHDWCYSGLRTADQRDIRTRIKSFVGKMYFNPSTPIPRLKGRFWSEGWGILAGERAALIVGLASQADQFGQVYADCRGGRLGFSLVAQADGILLAPGERFISEPGFIQAVALPDPEPAREYVEAVAREMHARVPETVPTKWTHWYHYFHNISEKLFMDNLSVIDSIRDVIPFKTVQLDDGYQSAWGDWYECNDKFPSGLLSLSKSIRDKGFTPGLWLAPFVADPKSKLAAQHPDWLVKDEIGKPIVSGFFWDFHGYSLDSSNPEVLDWLRQLMATVVKTWGFTFVKTDFTYAGALPGVRHDPKITRAQAYRKGMEAIREGIGAEAFLLGCGSPFGPSIGLVDAMRVGPDTAPNWNPFLWNMKFAAPFIKGETGIGALRNNVRQTLNLSVVHRRWWWSDPDCLMVRDYDTKLNHDEILSNVSLVGLMGGLVINSDDLTRLTEARQRLVALLCPVLSRGGVPLDLLENEMAEIFDLPMNAPWGSWHVTAVFNWSDQKKKKALSPDRLGFPSGARLNVYDFWRDTHSATEGPIDLGHVPPHGCRLLRITEASDQPKLVGSTLHITQGGEIESVSVQAETIRAVVKDLDRVVDGELAFSLPRPPRSVLVDESAATARSRGDGVWAVPLKAKGRVTVTVSLGAS